MSPTPKNNPAFLSDEELIAAFCVRTSEYESLMETLHQCGANSNPHLIVIGPRGSGKTTLLLRVAAEARRDPPLSSRFFPIVFAEESYRVSTAGEFWLECLSRLAEQAPCRAGAPNLQRTCEDMRRIRDDETLGQRCLGALMDFSDRERKRLLLIVENLNMMFADMMDPYAGWRLRKTLQTEPRIVLFASATSRFEEIDNPDYALYDLFQSRTLKPLDEKACADLWRTITGEEPARHKIRSLQILTGGNPRLLAIVARFGATLSVKELMQDLLDLVDDHTEYFKSHLESLPPQERRVYLALAELWKPATTREIADRSRLDTNKCSAWLKRLVDRGSVSVIGGTARRKLYYLSERMYNIYYLLRRSGSNGLVEALVRFMVGFYSPRELQRVFHEVDNESEELGHHIRAQFLKDLDQLNKDVSAVLAEGTTLIEEGRVEEALDRYDSAWELVEDLGPMNPAKRTNVFFSRGLMLTTLGRTREALDAFCAAVEGFTEPFSPEHSLSLAGAHINRGFLLEQSGQVEEELAAYTAVDFLGKSEFPPPPEFAAIALVRKGAALARLHRHEDALATYSEVENRFGESSSLIVQVQMANALLKKCAVLDALGRHEAMLATSSSIVSRYSGSQQPAMLVFVARGLCAKGLALDILEREEEALAAYSEVPSRFEKSESDELRRFSALALFAKGNIELGQERFVDAIASVTDGLERFNARSLACAGAHETRALAYLLSGRPSEGERDVAAMLDILAELDHLPTTTIDALITISCLLGPARTLELVQASSAEEQLFPFVVALKHEMGLDPRVAQEVKEVAQDVRQRLKEMKKNPALAPIAQTNASDAAIS